MPIDQQRTMEALDRAVTRFATLADEAKGDEEIPGCPGWTTTDLVVHVGAVHRWAAAIVLSGQRLPDPPTPLIRGALADWYAGCAAAMLTVLDVVDPEESVPNPARIGEKARYWARRQLHETTIHAVDLMQALGQHERQWAIDGDIAADGIEEVLGVYFPRMTARGQRPHVTERVRFDATDRFDSWITAPGGTPEGPPVLIHGNGDAGTAVRGTTTELYLALWNRLPLDHLHYDSDAARAVLQGPKTT